MPEQRYPSANPSTFDFLRDIYRDILAAAMLLTRIPVKWPVKWPVKFHDGHVEGEGSDEAEPDTARSYWAFGLIGLGVSAIPAMLAAVLIGAGVPALAAAAVIMALIALLTGGMHQDGLADVADSLGGRDPEHRLTIMRDSAIGSFGTIGLITVSVMTLASIADLASHSVEMMVGGVITAATLSRAMMAIQRVLNDPPTSQGLAHLTGRPSAAVAAIATLTSLVIAIVFSGFGPAFLVLAVGAVITLALGRFLQAWVGGVNGDGLGATQQLSEAAMLITLTIMAG
ncbi:MAG: Adenosylcobinamide-GDP ribazoletransferase [SAR116 cluster bacterium MED-G04]|nr:MAG: Adenosylcobinamide-GDP ribazoletransferase [SAR116 cluster bacterium MED-G04]